jgi:hypothetical protein
MAKRRGSRSDEQEWKSYSPVMMRLRSKPFVASESVKTERPVDLTAQSESAVAKKEKADREWKLWLVSDRPERVKHQKANFLDQCKLDYERLKKK